MIQPAEAAAAGTYAVADFWSAPIRWSHWIPALTVALRLLGLVAAAAGLLATPPAGTRPQRR